MLARIEIRGFKRFFVRTVRYVPLFVTLLALLIPSYGRATDELIAVLPWKVNAPGDVDYLKRAIVDMLSSRIGSSQAVELVKTNAIRDALGENGPEDITDEVAEEVGNKVGADYVLFGSLSVMGDSLSLDAKLVDVGEGSITPFYFRGKGIDSLVDMTEKMASSVLAPLHDRFAAGEVEAEIPSGPTYTGKFPLQVDEEDAGQVGPEKVEEKGVETEELKKTDDFIKTARTETEKEKKKSLWKSHPMKGFFTAFEAIDLDGDGKKEVVLISKRDILISRVEGTGLKVLKEIKGGRQVENIGIASTGGNDATPMVYISSLQGGAPNGQILEFKNGEFRVTSSGIPWLMRVVKVQGNGPQLLGQRYRSFDGFHGDVRVLQIGGDGVTDVGPFDLPEKVGLYGFELFDVTGDGEVELIALDHRNRLRLYKRDNGRWEEYWKSDDIYGGSLNFIEPGKRAIAASEREVVVIKGRFSYADLNSDGRMELIIKKNEGGGLLGKRAKRILYFKKGEILSLTWASEMELDKGFDENWRTKAMSGYIADFTVDDMDGDGTSDLTMLVVEGITMFRNKPKSYLFSFSSF
jgi:TolB-like protein